MGNHGFRLIAGLLLGAGVIAASIGVASRALADDSCLVSVHDESNNPISNGGSVCQNASGTSCTFNLKACVNDEEAGCNAGESKKKKIHAKGHCGAIGKLQVGAATGSSCGSTAGIKVHTKKHGKKAGTCNISIAVKTKDGRQDLDKFTLTCNPSSSPCPTTTTTTHGTTTTTTTVIVNPAGVKIVTTSSPGVLAVSGLPGFPFPPNVLTTIEVGAADANAKRTGIIPPGGFTVPVFCIPGLMFTSQVTPTGCASGGAVGQAVVWDSTSPNADPNVARVGDTSDGTCNPAGQPCTTAPGGAGNNTQGNINTTRGGSPSATGKVETLVDIPVHSLTWQAGDFSCPDTDGMFTNGVDTIITNFDFILGPTTGSADAKYVDLNGDMCSRAGAGPDETHHCASDINKPCGGASDPMTCGTANATCSAGPIHGTPASGPGCVVGQATTVVATGIAFSGGAPLFDLIFASSTPTTISACGLPSSTATCTLTTDPCQD